MISFMELYEGARDEILAHLLDRTGASDVGYVTEIVDSFLEMTDEEFDTGVGITSFGGCILVRIFDMGRYSFVYPIPLSDSADTASALDAIRAYAVKEELSLTVTDIPKDELCALVSRYRHMTLDASDPDGELYRAEILSECALVSEAPCVRDFDLELSGVREDEAADMERLYTSDEVNKYWGYDFREDVEAVEETYFYDTAVTELAMGTAMTMSARLNGEYIGEAVLHAFDLSGGAEVAIRLLPEWQGRGLGKRLLALSFEAAREIGLVRVYGSVMRENARSVAMLSRCMERVNNSNFTVENTDPNGATEVAAIGDPVRENISGEILRFVKKLY